MTDYTSEEFWKGAPDDAQGFMPCDHLWIAGWWKHEGGCFYFWSLELGSGGVWKKTYAKPFGHPNFQKRPTTQPTTWNGPEDGLPPVGTVCAIADGADVRYGRGESGPVIAHIEDCAVIRMSYGLGCFSAEVLRTKEQAYVEKVRCAGIEKICEVLVKHPCYSYQLAESLYDDGLRLKDDAQ